MLNRQKINTIPKLFIVITKKILRSRKIKKIFPFLRIANSKLTYILIFPQNQIIKSRIVITFLKQLFIKKQNVILFFYNIKIFQAIEISFLENTFFFLINAFPFKEIVNFNLRNGNSFQNELFYHKSIIINKNWETER